MLGLLAVTPGPADCQPLVLAGLLPLDDNLSARWPWSGTWSWPVGAASELARPSPAGEPAWRLLRGFSPTRDRHRGADLGNGRARDTVYAAAHGVVVTVQELPDGSGFGSHVVLAHRLREGGLAYSVYSHLRTGSTRMREGQCVWAGEPLGEVGRSGRATTNHLHFEVRLARDPAPRWEHAPAVDPIAFVERHLPGHRVDTSWCTPYLDWADRAALIEPGARAADSLSRETWQQMLSRAARLPLLEPPRDAPSLREALIRQGVLPEREHAPLDRAATWRDLRRDLASLAVIGTRLPPGPFETTLRRSACLDRFRLEQPARDLDALYRGTPPTVADACLLLADLVAGAPPPAAAPEDRPR